MRTNSTLTGPPTLLRRLIVALFIALLSIGTVGCTEDVGEGLDEEEVEQEELEDEDDPLEGNIDEDELEDDG